MLLISLIFIYDICFSQTFVDSTTGLRYDIDELSAFGSDISFLPKRIHIEDNKIILLADFEDQKEDTILLPAYGNEGYDIIPIYIINTTKNPLNLGNDGVLVLQQYKDTSGYWIRSQSFDPGWCGSSLPINITLNPNEFMKTIAFLNSEGNKEIVRYSLYTKDIKLVSNSGVGLVDVKEIEKAKIDYVSSKFINLDLFYRTYK